MASDWDNILNKIGAQRPGWKLLSKELSDIQSNLQSGNIVSATQLVKIKETWRSLYPFTDADGQHFVLYIYDHSAQKWRGGHGFKPPKFHFCWCQTLQRMESEGRRGRYKAKYDIESNNFDVVGGYRNKVTLDVCINCLKHMSYQNYNTAPYTSQQVIYRNFNMSQFFTEYGKQDLKKPTHQYHSHEYTNDWTNISSNLKARRNYTCEKCHKNMFQNKQNLHVHHKNGVKSDNSIPNLEVLCYDCHSKEPFHSHMRR